VGGLEGSKKEEGNEGAGPAPAVSKSAAHCGQRSTGPLRQAQGPVEQKVQMEELQWGFPIATPLSLNKPTSINGK